MTPPPREQPVTEHQRITAKQNRAGAGLTALSRGRADTRSMSGRGRCARREERPLRFGEIERDGRLGRQAAKNILHWQGWCLGEYECTGEMDQRTDRTAVVRTMLWGRRIGRRSAYVIRCIRADERQFGCRRRGEAVMHVAKRQCKLERKRKQRQVRTPLRT